MNKTLTALLILAIGIMMLVVVSPVRAQLLEDPPSVGDTMISFAYCAREEDAQRIAAAGAMGSDADYIAIMTDPQATCLDSRLFEGVPPVHVVLLERVFQSILPGGEVVQFWLAMDQFGNVAYIWGVVPSLEA